MKKLLTGPFTAVLVSVASMAGADAASISLSLSQSADGVDGSTPIDLTAEGDTDWGVFSNSTLAPSDSMSGGSGYSGMTYLGDAVDAFYNFNSQNNYSWTNGTPATAGSNTLTTNASLQTNGGVRLSISVASAGTYQLKFYTTTFDLNLTATASLLTGGVSDSAGGTYVENGLEKYEYTVDFTTDGADTLQLDVVKSAGTTVFAYEAFSLSTVPEPSSLIPLGLCGIGVLSRRRR